MTTAKLPRANVYIDGYNLYYGAVKGTKFHWLDLRALATALFPQYAIHRIKYFTARVKSRPSDPQEHVRQQMYLRALETTPSLTIFYGFYMNQPKLRPLADPNDCPGRKYVTILNWKRRVQTSISRRSYCSTHSVTTMTSLSWSPTIPIC